MDEIGKKKLFVKKELIITTCICFLPALIAILLYNKLPEQIPVQWGNNGVPSSYKSKVFACFGIPTFMAFLNIITNLTIEGDPKKKNASRILRKIVKWIIPLLTVAFLMFSFAWALGYELPIVKIALGLVGVIFILFGNYLPKSKLNYTVGFKLPWTLDNEENWNKTNHLAGYLMVIVGVIMLFFTITSIQINVEAIVLIVVLYSLIVCGYSYFLYLKKGNK